MTIPKFFGAPMRRHRHYSITDAPPGDPPQYVATVANWGVLEVWDSGRWEFGDPSGARIWNGKTADAQSAATECESKIRSRCEDLLGVKRDQVAPVPVESTLPKSGRR